MKSEKLRLRVVLVSAFITVAVGVLFYHHVENLSWLDAYYFSIVTLTTVGYGDIHLSTAAGKIFTTIYILVGVGIITTLITTLASLHTNRRTRKVSRRKK